MQSGSRADQRRSKMTDIRHSLAKMSIFKQTTLQLERCIEEATLKSPHNNKAAQQAETDAQESPSPQKCFSLLLEKYIIGEKIGEGAHGVVKKCSHRDTGQVLAMKSIRLDREHILFLKRNFTDIKHLHHRNIISYHALFLEMGKERCHLVMDYVPFPDLLHAGVQTEQQLKEIVYQVLQALAYIHSQGICHRDIKPENILYDQKQKMVKIIDFGISRKVLNRSRKIDMLTITGTLFYRAPEMFQGGGYDERVDLWALGATIYKLMVGRTPFESTYHSETISSILKGEFTFPLQVEQKYSKSARNLVSRLLKRRQERLTAKQALLDIWLIDLYQSADELTRSLTLNGRMLRIFGHSFRMNPEPFTRATTLKEGGPVPQSPEQIIRKLRSQQSLTEVDSKIYCAEQDWRRRSP